MSIVEAYAKLHGKDQDWYITGLPFVFGRKSEKSPEHFVDITLGEGTKTVSREHAVLTYSEEKKAYVLEIKGKSGCIINRKQYVRGERCCLYNKDAVEMAQCKFYFLLPTGASPEGANKEEEEAAAPLAKRVLEVNPSGQSPKRVETIDVNKKEK